jgi:dephospho-CoA kinase
MDEIVMVWAPEALRVMRVMERDHVEEAAVRERMQHQWHDDRKVQLSQNVIINDGEHSLVRQVMELHTLFLHAVKREADL